MLKITIIIDKEENTLERRFGGNYDDLYNADWNAKLQDMINALCNNKDTTM